MKKYDANLVKHDSVQRCEKCGTIGPRTIAYRQELDLETVDCEYTIEHLHVSCYKCGFTECMNLAPKPELAA